MLRRSLLAATASAFAAPALAQAPWPNRPLRMVIPWPPGQATDLAGRLAAQFLSEALGQNVVPENKAGAGGMIGTDAVAKATPDGYTLLAASSGPVSINPLFGRAPYDPERDLAPVAMLGVSAYSLVVRAGFPAATPAEFIALLRANPGKYSFSSSGIGATTHLIVELFNQRGGVQALHVPFSGSAASLTAVVAGQVDYTIETLASTGNLVRGGQLKSYGISVDRTSPLAPGLAPISQGFGMPGFDVGAWFGVMAPAGTPAPVVARLAAVVTEALANPAVRERFAGVGIEAESKAGAEFAAYLRRQKTSFAEIIRSADIKLD